MLLRHRVRWVRSNLERPHTARICIDALLRRPALLALGYHRIGDPAQARYDSATYSASPDAFYDQIAFLKRRYRIMTLEEFLYVARRPERLRAPAVLITFDDGYADNYSDAFPILKALGVQATFFLPSGLIGTDSLAWWDQIAGIIRSARRKRFALNGVQYDFERTRASVVTREILRQCKVCSGDTPSEFVAAVAEACDTPATQCATPPQFMTWDNAREMLVSGMAFGSHTHSHRLLGPLDFKEQYAEAVCSRDHLRRELGCTPRAMALPCGSGSPETASVLSRAGYEAAFSTDPAVNTPENWNTFGLRRVLVEYHITPVFFRTYVAMTVGRRRSRS